MHLRKTADKWERVQRRAGRFITKLRVLNLLDSNPEDNFKNDRLTVEAKARPDSQWNLFLLVVTDTKHTPLDFYKVLRRKFCGTRFFI